MNIFGNDLMFCEKNTNVIKASDKALEKESKVFRKALKFNFL